MAEIIVPVVRIMEVKPHPNAENLELVEVNGWQVVTGKGNVKPGNHVVHFPPQAVLPVELSDRLGVTKYLSNQRVKSVRLRGEVSHGFVAPLLEVFTEEMQIPVDTTNVADALGVTKYEPPVKALSGDAAPEVDVFPKYTSIENLRNYRGVFVNGEEVIVTEKVHGTNSRIGMVSGEMFAGSKGVRRKPPQTPDGEPLPGFDGYKHHLYWFPWSLESVQALMADLAERGNESVILYGEIYGGSVQKFDYGVPKGELRYVAFDLRVNGKFLDNDEFRALCEKHGVPMVPEVWRGAYDENMIKSLSEGGSLLGGDHIREGVVVKPLVETTDLKLGRKILKFVSSEYLVGDNDGVDDQA